LVGVARDRQFRFAPLVAALTRPLRARFSRCSSLPPNLFPAQESDGGLENAIAEGPDGLGAGLFL
jgi:hypothetical protein